MSDIAAQVKQIFDLMSSRLNPEAAKGLDVVIQFNLTGQGACSYFVEIKNGTCTCTPGTHPTPRLTTSMSATDFVKVCNRTTDPETLFNSGRLKLVGDMGLAMKMQTLFGRPPCGETS